MQAWKVFSKSGDRLFSATRLGKKIEYTNGWKRDAREEGPAACFCTEAAARTFCRSGVKVLRSDPLILQVKIRESRCKYLWFSHGGEMVIDAGIPISGRRFPNGTVFADQVTIEEADRNDS